MRVTATARRITLFLETRTEEERSVAYFDDVALIPYPCPIKECAPAAPPPERKLCVDWRDERRPRELRGEYEKGGFRFASLSGMPLLIATLGRTGR